MVPIPVVPAAVIVTFPVPALIVPLLNVMLPEAPVAANVMLLLVVVTAPTAKAPVFVKLIKPLDAVAARVPVIVPPRGVPAEPSTAPLKVKFEAPILDVLSKIVPVVAVNETAFPVSVSEPTVKFPPVYVNVSGVP